MQHRYGSVAMDLARRLLAVRPGDRWEPVGGLAETYGTGRGTVQAALRLLIDQGAVELESRGNLGSFVKSLNREKLFVLAGLSPVIGMMAVTYSLRFQGLATGLNQVFRQAGVPLVLAQLRGGKSRMELLRTGRCDFAVVSRMAWDEESSTGDLRLVLAFGAGSNVGSHALLVRAAGSAGLVDAMRVGVDASSHDHMRLMLDECQGKSVELIQISYAQAIPKLLAGEIDATVWDGGVAALPPGLMMLPLQRQPPAAADTEAVVVVRGEDRALADLIAGSIDPEAVRTIQQQVVSGELMPEF